MPVCTRGATPRLPGQGRRGWGAGPPGLREEGLGAENSGPPGRKGLEVCTPGSKGRKGRSLSSVPRLLGPLARQVGRTPEGLCPWQARSTPGLQASHRSCEHSGACGPSVPGARATRRQGFSGVGVIHPPVLKLPLWVFKSLRVPARQSKPTSKRACVTKPVPTPAPGWGAEPGAMGKRPSNNRALSAPSTLCHAPGTSISQALFRAGEQRLHQ